MEKVLVFPGDEIAVAEEFLPGDGAYEENGTVFAARLGWLKLDTGDFKASVEAVTDVPAVLKPGDVVIGTVESIRTSMAIVQVQKLASNTDRSVAGDTNGTLHVAKVADAYIESLDDAFHLKDILRAQVTSVDPSIQLSTVGAHLGVLKSYCPRCRTAMSRVTSTSLVCPECEWKATGKLAHDYGAGQVASAPVEGVADAAPRRPGGGGGRGRGFGRDRGERRGFGSREGGRSFGRDRGDRRGRGGGRGGRDRRER